MTWAERNVDRPALLALQRISQSLEARRRRNRGARDGRSVCGEVHGGLSESAGVRRVSNITDAQVQRW